MLSRRRIAPTRPRYEAEPVWSGSGVIRQFRIRSGLVGAWPVQSAGFRPDRRPCGEAAAHAVTGQPGRIEPPPAHGPLQDCGWRPPPHHVQAACSSAPESPTLVCSLITVRSTDDLPARGTPLMYVFVPFFLAGIAQSAIPEGGRASNRLLASVVWLPLTCCRCASAGHHCRYCEFE